MVDERDRKLLAVLGDGNERNGPSPSDDGANRVRNVDQMTVVSREDESVESPAELILAEEVVSIDLGSQIVKALEEVDGRLDLLGVLGGRVLEVGLGALPGEVGLHGVDELNGGRLVERGAHEAVVGERGRDRGSSSRLGIVDDGAEHRAWSSRLVLSGVELRKGCGIRGGQGRGGGQGGQGGGRQGERGNLHGGVGS